WNVAELATLIASPNIEGFLNNTDIICFQEAWTKEPQTIPVFITTQSSAQKKLVWKACGRFCNIHQIRLSG
ncbi:hypothetical protein NDU88_001483, partial [Pleurodeles waltl]